MPVARGYITAASDPETLSHALWHFSKPHVGNVVPTKILLVFSPLMMSV
jgi:hypothetical protein